MSAGGAPSNEATAFDSTVLGVRPGGQLLASADAGFIPDGGATDGGTSLADGGAVVADVSGGLPDWDYMRGEPWTSKPEVQKGLSDAKATIQSVKDGMGHEVDDVYWAIIDAMPPGLSPSDYLTEIAQNFNTAINNKDFDDLCVFTRWGATQAPSVVGDVYDITIKGGDNGSVMVVEKGPSYFIVQTVTTPASGTHPEYGSRLFGFRQHPDGSVGFLTRGVSRRGTLTYVSGPIGSYFQGQTWNDLTQGISDELKSRGARVSQLPFRVVNVLP
jgi:hypothetical protein